jgi:uncharacterized protein
MATDALDVATDTPRKPRRRRWPWILLAGITAFVLLGSLAASVYYSQLLGDEIVVNKGRERVYNLEVLAVNGGTVSYRDTDSNASSWDDVDYMAMTTQDGGWSETDNPTADDPATRQVVTNRAQPSLTAGQQVRFDGYYFYSDPKAGLDMDFQDVTYSSPLGPMAAWVVPGAETAPQQSDTWVIYTHGLGASRAEGLRQLSIIQPLGYTTMLITYRNDVDQPQTDGKVNFGSEEWEDLQGAVQYALDNGAEDVLLSGTSHGGAVTLGFLVNSPLADRVSGVFMDSPATDFPMIVELTADGMGVPGFITDIAMAISTPRFGIDWAGIDYTNRAAELGVPITIVQGTGDQTVPAEVNIEFAEKVNAQTDGLVDLQLFDGVAHTTIWNAQREAYTRILSDALAAASG